MDNIPKVKEAIAPLNPLVVQRYSATHRELKNLLSRLTPVDAYQRKRGDANDRITDPNCNRTFE